MTRAAWLAEARAIRLEAVVIKDVLRRLSRSTEPIDTTVTAWLANVLDNRLADWGDNIEAMERLESE